MYHVPSDYNEHSYQTTYIPDLDHAIDHMEAVLEILYGSKSTEELENHLEEVCDFLEMKIPPGNLNIQKKETL